MEIRKEIIEKGQEIRSGREGIMDCRVKVGRKTGDKECTVMDYLIGDEDVKGRIKRMKIGDRIDSDHHSVEIWVEGRVVGKRKGKRREGARRVR